MNTSPVFDPGRPKAFRRGSPCGGKWLFSRNFRWRRLASFGWVMGGISSVVRVGNPTRPLRERGRAAEWADDWIAFGWVGVALAL